MGRWLKILLGPLPVTVLVLPLLFAGGRGATTVLSAVVFDSSRSAVERWTIVATIGVILAWVAAAALGVLALWVVVLAEVPAMLREPPIRWWLATGLFLGLIAAGCWLWTMAVGGHSNGTLTWLVWGVLLLGPLLLGGYHLVLLLRR